MALTSLTVDKCNRVSGGVKRLFICDADEIATITYDVTTDKHEVDTLTFSGSTYFQEFTFKKGECRVESNTTRSSDTGIDSTEVSIFMNVPAPTSKQLHALEALRGTCELVAVVQEFGSENELRLYGADRTEIGVLEFGSLSGGTGSVRTDANTFELNLTGMQEDIPFIVGTVDGETGHDDIITFLLTGA
jgi:hypothetical protein|tara:strand:+ start:119 stop:688 length:570 start_codon:yes stop_codon:yes gene_type:complete